MSFSRPMFCFDTKLVKQNEYDVIGEICGVGGDKFFVVDDRRTSTSQRRRTLQFTRRELSSPEKITYAFSIPASGAYNRDDALYAACAGTTAIVARKQCCVDFYCPIGSHVTRHQLVGEPGQLGTTGDKVLIPLWEKSVGFIYKHSIKIN